MNLYFKKQQKIVYQHLINFVMKLEILFFALELIKEEF